MKDTTKKLLIIIAAVILALILVAVILIVRSCDTKEKSFTIDTNEMEVAVLKGETPDWSKLAVTVKMSDNTTKTLASSQYSLDVSAFNKDVAGEYVIKVTYGKLETKNFTVYVADNVPKSYKINRDAIPNTARIGSTFTWKDIEFIFIYDYNIERVHEVDYTVDDSGYDPQVAGVYTLKVICELGEFPFNITVNDDADNMFDDDKRVYFVHATYTLTGATNITLKDKNGAITNMPDGFLIKLEYGDYTLSYTQNGQSITREIRVIYRLVQMAYGANYTEYLSASGSSSMYLRKNAVTNYLVGTDNTFKLATNVKGVRRVDDDETETVTLNGTEWMLIVTLSVREGSGFSVKDDIATREGFNFNFNPAYAGKVIRIEITPRYQAVNPSTTITVEIELNDGLNAHNFEEFAQLYGNLDTRSLNLHSTLMLDAATIKPNQLNPDGSIKNYYENAAVNNVIYDGETLMENNTGNIFVRTSKNVTNNNLVVNGNYYTIDAENLPLIQPPPEGINNYPDQPPKLVALGISTEGRFTNLQTGIFYNSLRSGSRDSNLAAAYATVNIVGGVVNSDNSKQTYDDLENNSVTYNNLTLEGNSRAPRAKQQGQTDAEFYAMLERESGGHIGIRTHFVDVYCNNFVCRYTGTAVSMVSAGCDFEADYTLLTEHFCNIIYNYNASEIILKNSEIGVTGGSALMSEQSEVKNGSIYDFNVTLINTDIENYIMGTEAWFQIWGFSAIIPTMKGSIDQGLRAYTFNKMSMVKDLIIEGVGSEPVQCFNFAIMEIENFGDSTSQILSSLRYGEMPRVPHPATLLNSGDPRVQSGQFIAPVNQYSSSAAFGAYLYQVGIEIWTKISNGELDQEYLVHQYGSVDIFIYLSAMEGTFEASPNDDRWLEIYTPMPLPGDKRKIHAFVEYYEL